MLRKQYLEGLLWVICWRTLWDHEEKLRQTRFRGHEELCTWPTTPALHMGLVTSNSIVFLTAVPVTRSCRQYELSWLEKVVYKGSRSSASHLWWGRAAAGLRRHLGRTGLACKYKVHVQLNRLLVPGNEVLHIQPIPLVVAVIVMWFDLKYEMARA